MKIWRPCVNLIKRLIPDCSKGVSTNALRAINEYANKSGVGVRSMQIAYNDMPTSMKVGYLQKMVAKAGGDLSNPADVQALYDAADKTGSIRPSSSNCRK